MSDTTTTLEKLEDNLNTRYKDVFISYGRAESKAFATKLCEQLTQKGYKVWFDQNDIPLGVDFQHQIDEGIETAHNFIFIIAPHAVKSPYCRKEIELALKRGKRIIPILQIEPTTKEVWDMMHPAIGKINWVYMRQQWEEDKEQSDYETIDDFDEGFKGVLSLLEDEKEYVQKHTEILLRAIEWERNHHNSMHLLVANERKHAEEWLFTRFDKKQPPCFPSDLHARFIAEAKKNANNLQTDVFIASAEEENPENTITRELVIYTLSLYGYTSWTHVTDLSSGVDFHKAIRKGVEGADNLIFLITRKSLESEYCMDELEYAISLQKRVIPLRLEKIDESEFPEVLKDLQYIDFTDNREDISLSKNEKTDFEKDIDELLEILDKDKEYIQRHKILLTQALKWERQDKNPSMLLRGHNLDQAKIWLKIGQKRENNQPLQIHEDFIKESESKSVSEQIDVFISYSRTDGDIARKINENLQIAGKTTWFDQESIASGADFQKEIYQGIENADNIVFILSPESILSPYCADEVEYAQKLGKRFITLLYREINPTDQPTALAAVQWIDFRANHTKFEKQFAEMLRTLDTDREHVQAHTKWQKEAMEWEEFEKNEDFLLRGNELTLANKWLEQAKENKKIPLVTELQEEFLKASLKKQNKVNLAIERNKQIFIAAIAIILAVAVLAGSQWYKSYQHQKELAVKNLIFESKELLRLFPDRALQLSKAAYQSEKELSLSSIKNFYTNIEETKLLPNKQSNIFTQLEIDEYIHTVVSSENQFRFVVVGDYLYLFDKKGEAITAFADKQEFNNQKQLFKTHVEEYSKKYNSLRGNYGSSLKEIPFIDISDDGKYIVTHSDNGKITLYDEEARPIRQFKTDVLANHSSKIFFADLENQLRIVVARSEIYTSKYPTYISVFDTVGNLLSDHDDKQIVWDNQNQLYQKTLAQWEKIIGEKTAYTKGYFREHEIHFEVGNYTLIQEDKEKAWKLTKKNQPDSLIAIYNFPESVYFSSLGKDKIAVHDGEISYIFATPNTLKEVFEQIPALSPEEKIEYQIANIDDYRKVPSQLANLVAKGVLFMTVFLLSILVLNYFNMLFLSQRYFKILLYLVVGLFVGTGWVILIMDENYVVPVAFASGLSLSIAGIIFGIKDVNRLLYFNGTLFLASGGLLVIGTASLFHYINRVEGTLSTLNNFFGGVNIFIWLTVGITWFAIEKAAKEFSERNFNYFADWIGIAISTVLLFIGLSITKLSLTDDLTLLFLLLILPSSYFLRTLAGQYVLYKFQKSPYSLTTMKGYIPALILLFLLFIGLVIDEYNTGENIIFRSAVIGLFIYVPLFYFYTIFVAFKQKDKINLRANFLFWWTILLVIFALIPSIGKKEESYVPIIVIIIWSLPLLWWGYKFFKNRKLRKQRAVE
ncbi:toll/interleukin-1 receptor domain-containing protein [Bernardetia sp.]|uniref:toll/interleukin-1 receptor domain-containing protein n=1 Tax=Bernardetia sp. TaxID=1937974 RepID=UPI0025BE72FA|nr:toll/interleukin-1 receptor domain-containing protein [Bernardetia sp.]